MMMKRFMCAVLAALLACLCTAACAETAVVDQSVIDAFSNTWLNADGQGFTVDIWNDEGEFDLVATLREGEDALYSVEFESCEYDAGQNALVCGGGTLALADLRDESDQSLDALLRSGFGAKLIEVDGFVFSDTGNGEEEEEEETLLASGFGATLTLESDGRLRWAGADIEHLDGLYEAQIEEDDGRFVGEWECGEDWMIVDKSGDVYTVYIVKSLNEDAVVTWEYTCALDTAGTLNGTGRKVVEPLADDAAPYESYADGEAIFALDSDAILWTDAVDDAGQGMRFTRDIETEEELEELGEDEEDEDEEEDESL